MNTHLSKVTFAAALITAALNGSAIAQQDEKLGKLSFPTSCDPKVEATRGIYLFLVHAKLIVASSPRQRLMLRLHTGHV